MQPDYKDTPRVVVIDADKRATQAWWQQEDEGASTSSPALDYCMQIRDNTHQCPRRVQSAAPSRASSPSMILLLPYHLTNLLPQSTSTSWLPRVTSRKAKAGSLALTSPPDCRRRGDKSVASGDCVADTASNSRVALEGDYNGGSGADKVVDVDGRGWRRRSRRRGNVDPGRVGLEWFPQDKTPEKEQHHKNCCLVIRGRQIVSPWITVSSLLFLVLIVTTSALPPVIRIGKLWSSQ